MLHQAGFAAFIAFFSDALARAAIPLFFIISGFLFFYYFPANGVLWYVRDLLILIVFSPVIYWLLKRAGHFLCMH